MTRKEQLVFCTKCLNRKMNSKQGLVCKLTGEKATFQNECSDFKHDETVKETPLVDKKGIKQQYVIVKQYLKSKPPKISLVLTIVFFISNILTLYFPKLTNAILLYPSNLYEPLNWYRLLSYPLYIGGLFSWFHISLIIVLTGYIIENKIRKLELLGLVTASPKKSQTPH